MRVDWIDIAKGIGIIFVVVGHNLGVWKYFKDVAESIYLFHMPLFFFLTGCTVLSAENLRSRSNRVITIAAQYFLLSSLLIPAVLIFDRNSTLIDLVKGIFYGTGHTIPITPLWFLTALSLSLCIFYTLLSIQEEFKKNRSTYFLPIVALLALWLEIEIVNNANIQFLEVNGWGSISSSGAFWNLDLVPIAIFFISLGAILSGKISNYRTSTLESIFYILLATAIVALMHQEGAKLDLNYRKLFPPLMAIVASFAGIFVVVVAAKKLSAKANRIGGFLRVTGQSSLIILALHNGLQNRGILYVTSQLDISTEVKWTAGACLGLLIPLAIDQLIIRRNNLLRAVFYPHFFSPPRPDKANHIVRL